ARRAPPALDARAPNRCRLSEGLVGGKTMRYTWVGLAFGVLFLASGCGSAGPKSTAKAEGEDATAYAKATKESVQQFAKAVKENPKQAGGLAEALLERLQVYTSRPVGENKAIYEELTQKCKSLLEAAKKSPGSAEVQKIANDMAALANKLPG